MFTLNFSSLLKKAKDLKTEDEKHSSKLKFLLSLNDVQGIETNQSEEILMTKYDLDNIKKEGTSKAGQDRCEILGVRDKFGNILNPSSLVDLDISFVKVGFEGVMVQIVKYFFLISNVKISF